jgi:asparagine synthase (glutamine-hydrolysing)
MNAPLDHVLRLTPGEPWPNPRMRRRPVGRIGGIVGAGATPPAQQAMRRALGPGAQVLNGETDALVADWDACWLDGERIVDLARWSAIAGSRRIGEVRGAFALAFHAADGTLRLARDAIGGRTLFVAQLERGIVFASTLHAVLASGIVPRTLDHIAVAAYLSFGYLPGERTLIKSVYELLPGEVLDWRPATVQRARLWSLPAEPDSTVAMDETVARDRLRALLETAVRRCLPEEDEAPIAATVSGGIDSSLVLALARKLHRGPLCAWSVSFGAEHRNELAWSHLVAGHCQVEHRVLELPPAAIIDNLDATIAVQSDPIGDPLTVPNALLFRETGRDVQVVLNGEGGDPLFGGPKNLPMLLTQLLGDGRNGGDIGAFGPESAQTLARERSYLRAHEKCYDDLAALLRPSVRAALAGDPLERFLADHFADARWHSFVVRLQAINLALKGAHHILHKVDELSSLCGVLPRAPLFDRDVAEAAFALPPQMRLKGSIEKYLLKRAVEDLLPAAILARPKSGMLVPVEAWFRGPLRASARERLLDGLSVWNLFERAYLEKLLAGKLPGLRPRHGIKIWLLVTLESWLRSTLGAARHPRASENPETIE